MLRFAVLAQRLPVVAGHDDDGLASAFGRKRADDQRYAEIGCRHLSVVRAAGEFRREGRRRIVRRVRIVEVYPEKKWTGRRRDPSRRLARDFRRAPLERRHGDM